MPLHRQGSRIEVPINTSTSQQEVPQWALALTTAVQNLTFHIDQQAAAAPAEEILDDEEELDDNIQELDDEDIDVDHEMIPSESVQYSVPISIERKVLLCEKVATEKNKKKITAEIVATNVVANRPANSN